MLRKALVLAALGGTASLSPAAFATSIPGPAQPEGRIVASERTKGRVPADSTAQVIVTARGSRSASYVHKSRRVHANGFLLPGRYRIGAYLQVDSKTVFRCAKNFRMLDGRIARAIVTTNWRKRRCAVAIDENARKR